VVRWQVPAVTFTTPDGTSIEGKAGAVTLQPGGQPVHIGLTIDARNVKPGTDLLESVKIRTDADVAGESAASANNENTPTPTSSETSRASTGNGGRSERSSGASGPPQPEGTRRPRSCGVRRRRTLETTQRLYDEIAVELPLNTDDDANEAVEA
jgi:hypothetical protein